MLIKRRLEHSATVITVLECSCPTYQDEGLRLILQCKRLLKRLEQAGKLAHQGCRIHGCRLAGLRGCRPAGGEATLRPQPVSLLSRTVTHRIKVRGDDRLEVRQHDGVGPLVGPVHRLPGFLAVRGQVAPEVQALLVVSLALVLRVHRLVPHRRVAPAQLRTAVSVGYLAVMPQHFNAPLACLSQQEGREELCKLQPAPLAAITDCSQKSQVAGRPLQDRALNTAFPGIAWSCRKYVRN